MAGTGQQCNRSLPTYTYFFVITVTTVGFGDVVLKVIEKLVWSYEKAAQVELEYRRFLYALAHKLQEDLISPPTPEVDEFWHQHILDTRRDREDCERVFGRYVDHTPGLEPEEQTKADAGRRRVYTEHDIDFMSFDGGDGSDNSMGTGGESHRHHASHVADGGHHTSGHDASAQMGAVMVVTAVGMVATVAEVGTAVAMEAAAVVAVGEATPRYGIRKQGKLESARASKSIICAIELFRWPPSRPAGYDFQYTSAPVNP